MRSKKQDLVQFLSENGIDVCFLDETHLGTGQVFWMSNYVCHSSDCPTLGDDSAILVRRGIDHCTVPVSGLQQLETSVVRFKQGARPVKLVAIYLPPLHAMVDADLSASNAGGIRVLMAGNVNAKHHDWNSRVNSHRGIHCLRTGHTNHRSSLQTAWPWCPRYSGRPGLRPTGESNSILRTKFGLLTRS